MSFEAEAINSGGEKFATFKVDASSLHYPAGVIYHGANSGALVPTSSSKPFPVEVWNNSSGSPFFVRGVGDSTIPVSGTVSVSGYVAPSTTVTVTGYVAPSTTVTVTGYTAPSTTVTVSNAPGTVPQSAASAGGVVAQALVATSAGTTVMTASGRLYGLSMSNQSTSENVWVKVFQEDTGGITLGTTEPVINVMIPFGGGREMSWTHGIDMSSGMSLSATDGAPSTAHSTPATTPQVTAYFKPSS